MNEQEIQQKKINVWEQAPLYDWPFDSYYNMMAWSGKDFINKKLEVMKKCIQGMSLDTPDKIRSIIQNKNEQIELKLSTSIVRSDVAPELSREIILQALQKDSNQIQYVCILASVLSADSSGYKLIKHALQYGPFDNWDETIAYDVTLDKKIEKFLLLPQLSAEQQKELDLLLQQNPSCGVLQAKKAFVLLGKGTFLSLSEVKNILRLLEQAIKNGIPDKYKYFIANLPLNFRLKNSINLRMSDIGFNSERYFMSDTYRNALQKICNLGLDVFSYLVLPNPATEEKLREMYSHNHIVYRCFDSLKNKIYNLPGMQDVIEAADIMILLIQEDTKKEEEKRQKANQGCCIWLIISLAGWSALGGTIYWLWTII